MNDDRLERGARRLLDESLGELDGETLERLRRSRLQALAAGEKKRRGRWLLWGVVPTLATALLLVLLWPKVGPIPNGIDPGQELPELSLLTLEEPLDFYQEEMEFYEWLSEVMDNGQAAAAPAEWSAAVHGVGLAPADGTAAGTGTAGIPRDV